MAKKKPTQKKPTKKPSKIRESENEEAENENETENDETETESEDEDSGGDDHADKDKDAALIKKMIDEHLGDGAKKLSKEESEALGKLGKEAYQAHQDMGKKEDEAYKCAGEAVKLAHHMASKHHEEETESEDEGDQPPPKKKKPAADDHGDDGDDDDDGNSSESENESEDEGKKESKVIKTLKKQLLEAAGRIAALEAKDNKTELDKYVEAELKKSGQPVVITKRFREAAGKLKSKADFDSKWKLFIEGVKGRRSEVAEEDFSSCAFTERATTTEDGERVTSDEGSEDGFADCAD
jgi:hypothetical protein